jgi:hypothetical protein
MSCDLHMDQLSLEELLEHAKIEKDPATQLILIREINQRYCDHEHGAGPRET